MGGHWSDRFCDSGDCEEILLFFPNRQTNKTTQFLPAPTVAHNVKNKLSTSLLPWGAPSSRGRLKCKWGTADAVWRKLVQRVGRPHFGTCLWPSRLALIWTPVFNGQLFPERCPSYPLLQCPCYLTVYNVHWIVAFILLSVFPNKNSLLRRCLSVVLCPQF